jgi:uncharacterized protein YecE (DUF72 family)
MQNHVIHIGTSGWSYKHWLGTFYPQGTKAKEQFPYYIKYFNTVEINNTFYRLPKKETFQNWKNEVPDDFIYVIKASRYITHMKKLHDPEKSTAVFLEHAAILGKNLGAILFQLPPSMKADAKILSEFLDQLPTTTRYVFEFRNSSWYQKGIYDLLQKHNCAFCIYELDRHLSPIEITADFVYLRLHGPGKKYQGDYDDKTLSGWARLCEKWLKTKDVFVYFDNDEKGYAAFNAIRLKELIEI